MSDSIKELAEEIRQFVDARNWYAGGCADLKGIAISIALEAAELLEHFQWVKDTNVAEKVETNRTEIQDELADVVIYALQFADRAGIDLGEAVREKMRKNGERWLV